MRACELRQRRVYMPEYEAWGWEAARASRCMNCRGGGGRALEAGGAQGEIVGKLAADVEAPQSRDRSRRAPTGQQGPREVVGVPYL